MQRLIVILAMMGLTLPTARSAEEPDHPVAREMKRDVILRAMVDELERNQAGLKLEDLQRPFFIEYALTDAVDAHASAILGAVVSRNQSRSRTLRTQVRVGSYELDNTNFQGDGSYSSREAPVPLEDDYAVIRQAIWWASDRNYKSVVETFAQKKAFMESKMIQDKPTDFSREPPEVYLEDRADMPVDLPRLEGLVVGLSRVFRNYSAVQESQVTLRVQGGNRYLVNTEGTRIRTRDLVHALVVNATVQADDGMKFSDSLRIYARTFDAIPSMEELAQQCGEMVKRLVEVKNAPKLDRSYTGPVLFEAEAAAPLFLTQFGQRFTGGQRAVGSRTSPDDFANKLERRILPRFLDVLDDPTRDVIADTPVIGHYDYDDQAVKARPASLVEAGRLKALLMSRNPSREFSRSTGHGRSRGAAAPACLVVTSRDGSGKDALRKELIEACQDEGLEFGLRVSALGGGGPGTPLAIHKVYPDGREERVRGVEIARIDIKAFKRILAAGDSPYVFNAGQQGGQTCVAPALLFEELDLAKIDRDFDKPPILPPPLER